MHNKVTITCKWIRLMFLITFLTFGLVQGAEPRLSPDIVVMPELYDFGEVTAGQVVSHLFKIKNTGQADLSLGHVYASCGCSKVRLQAYQVKPGGEIRMEVELDNGGKAEGLFSGVLEIASNDPQEPVKKVHLKANIKVTGVKTGDPREVSGWTTVSPQQYISRLKNLSGVVLVDVRSQQEYQEGHIPGSKLIPLDRMSSEAEVCFESPDTPIVVYCRSGKRSRQAAQLLVAMGYRKIYDMGGINDWPFEIERKSQ